jgi:hypothetical protein
MGTVVGCIPENEPCEFCALCILDEVARYFRNNACTSCTEHDVTVACQSVDYKGKYNRRAASCQLPVARYQSK